VEPVGHDIEQLPPGQFMVQEEPAGHDMEQKPPRQSISHDAPAAQESEHWLRVQLCLQTLAVAQVVEQAAPVTGQSRSHFWPLPHSQMAEALQEPPVGRVPLVPLSPLVPLLPLVPLSPAPPLVPVPSVKSYEQPCASTAPTSAVSTSKGDERITTPA